MTYQSFANEGYLLTEAERQVIEAEIIKQYSTAIDLINGKIAKLIQKARDVGIEPADQYNWVIQFNRLETLRADIVDTYKDIGGKITALQEEAFKLSFENQFYRTSYALEWLEPVKFTVFDPNLARYAMTGELEVWKKIALRVGSIENYVPVSGTLTALIKAQEAAAIKSIYAQINAGLISGESYRQIALRIENIIGTVYDGRVSGEMYKALRIAHTEGHRAQNMAEIARANIAESQGLILQKMWDSTLDVNVRGAHAALDGVRIPLDGYWNMEGHKAAFPGDPTLPPSLSINCRCHSITVTENYVPEGRRGRNPITGENEVLSYKTYSQWAGEHNIKTNKYGRMYVQGPS